MPFDVIGDIHGRADALHRLLRWMGYSQQSGTWKHAERAKKLKNWIDSTTTLGFPFVYTFQA
ncbi:MAG TPA: hypothetical protein VK638_20665 [Edaphobacter sp.]|nr:hypothetical protein [Edaphobacter sp.]